MTIEQLLKAFKLKAIYGLDFETYWASDYTLKQIPTTEYICDPRFKAHCVSVQRHDEKRARTLDPAEFKRFVKSTDWSCTGTLGHHNHFDGLIASRYFNCKPAAYFCTLSMARPVMPITVGGSLVKVCAAFGRRAKKLGAALENTKGLRDLTPQQYRKLAAYAGADIEDTWWVFNKLLPYLTLDEMRVIDLTIKMYAQPSLLIDAKMTQEVERSEIERKQALYDVAKLTPKQLGSNAVFAAALRAEGVEPPVKIKPVVLKKIKAGERDESRLTQADTTFAFAKNDLDFQALLKHRRKRIRSLAAARLAVKGGLLEKRARRMTKRAAYGPFAIYLNYSGAKTLRWSGADKMNAQNFTRGSDLRKAIHAPRGTKLLIADLAQIEARLNAWFNGQQDMLDAFAAKQDVYKLQASAIYAKPVEAISKDERFVGKVCVAEGTLVLCERGWTPIERVSLEDRIWDGESWRAHQGLLDNGLRETVQSCGVYLTPEHRVFTGENWVRADSLLHDEKIRTQALEHAAANLPLLATYSDPAGFVRSSFAASAVFPSTRSTYQTSRLLEAHAVMCARTKPGQQNGIGNTPKQCRMTNIVAGSLIAWLQRSTDVITPIIASGITTVGAVFKFILSGAGIKPRFFGTSKLCLGGTGQNLKWTVPMLTADTNLEISDSLAGEKTLITDAFLVSCKKKLRVYDLRSVAHTNRFVVFGENGPLIVHNCVLSLGYQAGAKRFAHTLRTGSMGPPVPITDSLAQSIVSAWRASNQYIKAGWQRAKANMLSAFVGLQKITDGVVTYEGVRTKSGAVNGFIHLPGGMALRYDDVQADESGGVTYLGSHKDRKKGGAKLDRQRLYGGLIIENLIQALARRVIVEHLLALVDKMPYAKFVLTVHDELVFLVPTAKAPTALKIAKQVMSTPPVWAPDLPLAVDAHISDRYDK